MKIFNNSILLATLALLAVGCHEPIDPNEQTKSENIGYLTFSDGVNVDVVIDHKNTDSGMQTFDQTEVTTPVVDVNTFDCYICKKSGEVISQFKYGEKPTEPISLEAGDYILKMSSGDMTDAEGNKVDAAWESPVYGLSHPFKINIKQTTELNNLVCTLQNIQTTVKYSADLRACLSDDTIAKLTVGGASLEYSMTETRAGFFTAPEAKNDIDILITGTYTAEGKQPALFEFTNTIKDVIAGQYRDIQLYIKYSEDGNINISVTIDGWVIDNAVTFDLADLVKEDVMIDDTDKPTVTLVGGDIDQPLLIAAEDFDANGNCTKSVVVDIATKSAIKSLVVGIESNNYDMIASLANFSLTETFDLCAMGSTAATFLSLMEIPCNEQVLGQPSVTYDITALMKRLKAFAGEHKFTATVTDEQGGITTKTLTINMDGKQADPSIVWVGHNINNRYTVTDDLTVDIVISASKGIKGFTVQIISDTLTPDQLEGILICDVLDLVNPEKSYSTVNPNFNASNVQKVLSGDKTDADPSNDDGLGFPTGDQVKDQVQVNFSITKFLGLLSVTGAGNHDFVMTVTDNEDNVITKTLMIETVKK